MSRQPWISPVANIFPMARACEDCLHELLAVEGPQVVDAFAYPDEANRDIQFIGDPHDDAPFRRPVELGQDDTRHPDLFVEHLGLHDGVLSRCCVEDEKDFMGRAGQFASHDPLHLLQFFHEVGLGVEPTRRIDEHDVRFAIEGDLDGVEND